MNNLVGGIKKFDGTGYEVWSTLLEAVLTVQDVKWVLYADKPVEEVSVAGTGKAALVTSDEFIKWKKADDTAQAAILLSLKEDLVSLIMACRTAKDQWRRLKEVHSQQSESCKLILQQEFYSIKMQPGNKVSTYVAEVELLAKKLRDVGVTIDDDTLISKIVSGLTSEFKHFMSQWLSTAASERTYSNLLPRLLAEESMSMSSSKQESVAMKATALRKPANGKAKKPKKELECYHCGIKGHLKRECRKLKREQGDEQPQEQRRHAAMARTSRPSSRVWFFDSGASYHMTSHIEWINNYQEHDRQIPITVGNSETVYALGSGSVDVLSRVNGKKLQVTMHNVQYVPLIGDNLFSQGAADEKGVMTVAHKGKLELVSDGTTIIQGSKEASNMYVLDIDVVARASVARAERSLDEWHRVLGHPGTREISNMVKKGCTRDLKVVDRDSQQGQCGDCASGKTHHVCHPASTRQRSEVPLHRVHMDLVGPVEPPTLGGSRYFLLARDEFTGYMHVYCMRSKSETVDKVIQFNTEASIASQRHVQIIRSDNGSEFKNQAMTAFCQSEGIVQEFSASYTPQQNGEIERANRTVIEAARTILQASGLPLSLWGEAVLTAVYLRNRLTNSRNQEKTPFELFNGKPPVYSHLMEFGQEIHLLDTGRATSKFASKTIEAYMVGYESRNRTYRCYLPDRKDIVLSSDVVIATHRSSTREANASGHEVVFSWSGDSAAGCFAEVIDQQCLTSRNPTAPSEASADANEPEVRNQPDPVRTVGEARVEEQTASTAVAPVEPEQQQAGGGSERPTGQMLSLDDLTIPEGYTRQDIREILNGICSALSEAPEQPAATTQPAPPTQTAPSIRQAPTSGAVRLQGQGRVRVTQTTMGNRRPELASFQRGTVGRSSAPSGSATLAVRTGGNSAASRATSPRPGQKGPNPLPTQRQEGGTVDKIKPGPSIGSMIRRITPPFEWSLKNREKRNVPSRFARVAKAAVVEPQTYEDAVNGPDKEHWRAAIKSELESLAKNGTWKEVPKTDQRELTVKWVFKTKLDAEGHVYCYKARLVVRGYSQVAGLDYGELYAPVVHIDSLRLLFSICAELRLTYKQFDVATAFLNGDLEEELYIQAPEGVSLPPNRTLRLIKSMYGLKQAPRCFNKKFKQALTQLGMQQTHSDPCVYVQHEGEPIILALYVDDGIVFAKSQESIQRVLDGLRKSFELKVVDTDFFLGLEIVHSHKDSSVFIHQRAYTRRILENYGFEESRAVGTPLEAAHSLNKPVVLEGDEFECPYAALLGSLNYLATRTRPDLSYAMSVCSKFTDKPRVEHWQALKRILRYLHGTADYGLLYKATRDPRITIYSDADYGGDHENRRSISGMACFLNTAVVSYKARQQAKTSQSTTEAEYIACAMAVKEVRWLATFVSELGLFKPPQPTLFCDNQSAIRLIKNNELHDRTKHIDIRHHAIREDYEDGVFTIEYVQTDQQVADIFTKALYKDHHQELCHKLGLISYGSLSPGRVLE